MRAEKILTAKALKKFDRQVKKIRRRLIASEDCHIQIPTFELYLMLGNLRQSLRETREALKIVEKS